MKILYLCILTIFFASGITQAQSLYADVKARNVGDILSVIIVESANASQESKSKSKSESDMGANASVSGNVTDFLPVFGAKSSLESAYNGSNGSEQKDRLTGKITVRILEKSETGMLKIKGERKLEVNGESNLMQLEGYVRARDITTNNTVLSYQVADAKITYRKSGVVNSMVGPGTVSKLFTGLLGAVALAVAGGLIIL